MSVGGTADEPEAPQARGAKRSGSSAEEPRAYDAERQRGGVPSHVALLGGTFDPVHNGHLVVAQAALDLLGVDEVRLLVAGDPWQKRTRTPAAVRLELARLAVEDHDEIGVEAIEVDRDGPTYTFDTLAELTAREPMVQWTFLLGADAAAGLPTWKYADEVLLLARFVAVTRPGFAMPPLPVGVGTMAVPALDISSSELRALAAAGRSLRYLVPESVRRRIGEWSLYGPEGDA